MNMNMDTITTIPSIIRTVRIMPIAILMLTPMIRMIILTIQMIILMILTILPMIISILPLPPTSLNALENSL